MTNREALTAILAFAMFALPFAASPQAGAASSGVPATTAAAAAEDIVAKRQATIAFGIEVELVELFKTLGAEKENRYNADIRKLFAETRNPRIRVAILELWRSLAWKDGEDEALAEVRDRDKEESPVVAASLAYLAEIKSVKALDYAPALIEENDKALLPSLVALLGKAGSGKEEEILLAWLKGDAPSASLREAAIRALGDIGSKKAGEALAKILEDTGASRFERVYAAGSLAKIGWKDGLDSIIKAANGEDTTVQAAAVEALGSFEGSKAEAALMEALRASYAKSRVAACKAIAKMRLADALPNLRYKATSDPDKAVKYEALRALATIGGSDAFSFVASVMKDKKAEGAMRVLAFGLLARFDARPMETELLALLEEESKTLDRNLYLGLVREMAGAADAPDLAPLARFLVADKDYLIRIGGVEWARVAKAKDFAKELGELAAGDPNEAVRRRAGEALAAIGN